MSHEKPFLAPNFVFMTHDTKCRFSVRQLCERVEYHDVRASFLSEFFDILKAFGKHF